MAFFVFNDIKIKVWKFENKPRAYFRGGAYFRDCFRAAIWGAYFRGAYFRGGLFSGLYGMLLIKNINDSFKNEFVNYQKERMYSQNTIQREQLLYSNFEK